MDISIIIVNYNSASVLKSCLESILQQQSVNDEIIIIDNASTDNSLAVLRSYRDQCKIVLNDKNQGFGQANNQGFQLSQGRYILLLNPDTCLRKTDDLKHLVEFMDQNPKVGLAGVCLINLDGTQQKIPSSSYPGEKHIGYPYRNLPGNIAWVLGACMILPREVYEKANGFHPDFFLYGEDMDLCFRIRKLGFLIGCCDAIKILHIGGVSESQTNIYDKILKKQKALHLFYKKYYTTSAAKFLVKRDLKRAGWRKLYYRITFSSLKYKRYSAIYNSSKEFLLT